MATAVPSQQQNAPEPVRNVVNFLRNKASIPTKHGILGGRRVEYFKGKYAAKAILSPAYKKLKNVPQVATEQDAVQLLSSIIPFAFYLKIERGALAPAASPAAGAAADRARLIRIQQAQDFNKSDYFVWLVDPNPLRLILMGVGMIALVLAGVMFPLWPVKMRIGVWYLSMALLGLLGVFFAIAIVRLILYAVTMFSHPPGIWIFPNLFADVGFVDSFIPLWEWEGAEKERKRVAKLAKKGKKAAPQDSVREKAPQEKALQEKAPQEKVQGRVAVEDDSD